MVARARKALPPVRLVWAFLLVLGIYGVLYLGGMGLLSLGILPTVAVVTDLLFQRLRFPRLRSPEPALATGLFLALLFPPTVSVPLAAVVVLTAITFRHVLRWKGRPWFNPAALGVVLAAVFLGFGPAWWVALTPTEEILLVAFGLVLLGRNLRPWRLVLTFFVAYAGLSLLDHAFFGGATSPAVLALGILDPVTIFFGLFMLTEPRTSPKDPHAHPLVGGIVAILAVFLPLALPSLGILVALLAGNALAMILGRGTEATSAVPHPTRARKPIRAQRTRGGLRSRSPTSWSPSHQITAGVAAGVILLAVAATAQAPPTYHTVIVSAPPSSGGTSPSVTNCQSDNPSIPSGTLSALHHALGPSVILSYDSNTGIVVFYDPVDHVTVTETDLYEDFGYAEFNGDDFAVTGCAPSG